MLLYLSSFCFKLFVGSLGTTLLKVATDNKIDLEGVCVFACTSSFQACFIRDLASGCSFIKVLAAAYASALCAT